MGGGLYKGLVCFLDFHVYLWLVVAGFWRMSGDGAEPFLGCEDGVEF